MSGLVTLSEAVSERDHCFGSPMAPLTLIEYGDYECPNCRAVYPVVRELQVMLAKKLRFVFRNFPLTEIHPNARMAAETAEAAGLQGKFWQMHDLLFENQASLTRIVIASWAKKVGLDLKKFGNDVKQSAVPQRIEQDCQSGVRSGVNATPTFFINGVRYDGLLDTGSLFKVLQSELTQK